VTNQIEPWPAGATPSVDHILPQKEILDIPGFRALSDEDKAKILSDPGNLQPLPLTDNCSKRAKLGCAWTGNKAQGTVNSPAYMKALKVMQDEQRDALEKKIKALIPPPPPKPGG
jgi:hypothetical protein